jgi:hypothetical protein
VTSFAYIRRGREGRVTSRLTWIIGRLTTNGPLSLEIRERGKNCERYMTMTAVKQAQSGPGKLPFPNMVSTGGAHGPSPSIRQRVIWDFAVS